MAIDRKAIMVVAAVAGIGLLLYMRKSGNSAALGSSGGLLGAASSAANWASQPIVINTTTKPQVVDGTASGTRPAAAPAPAPADVGSTRPTVAPGGAVWGGTTGSGPQITGVDNGSSYGKPGPNGTWIWPDGTTSKQF
ncbi:hypothetical protein LJR129_002492 [Acidovorax sp. LjRoot129]|uniref:hypothetical protein n=1 Tax=Acidovorax sp. LjRoot129 TaxID=3342260 RepID=UPI003ECEFD1A